MGGYGMSFDALTQYMGDGIRLEHSAVGLSNAYQLNASSRFIYLDPNSQNTYYRLPDATTLETGGPLYHIKNISPWTNTYLVDYSGTTYAMFKTGNEATVVLLLDNSTSAGVWICLDIENKAIHATS
jgi:hypothetical protein